LILSVQGNTVKRKNCSFLKKRTKKLLLRRGHDLVLKQDRLERRQKRTLLPPRTEELAVSAAKLART
jgi:hypothetical protein